MAHTAFVASGSKVPSSRDGLTDIFIDDTVASLEGTFKSGELFVLIDSFRSSDEGRRCGRRGRFISSPDPPQISIALFVPLGSTEFFVHAVILFSFRVKVTHRQLVCWCRHLSSFFLRTLKHSFASFNVNETVCSVVHTVKGARFFSIDNNMRSLFTLELSLSSEPAYAYKKFTLGCERMRSSGKSERRRLSR